MVDASAIVSILARRPGSDALLARLDAYGGPFLATPVALLDAAAGLARAKAGGRTVTPTLLGRAREAVAELAAALALREVPVSADLGRRAADLLAAEGGEPGRALSAAAARAYRVELLAAG
ncbi:PIN domain-containing protein [Lichenibacterium dinghuense]|uniref:PIN domain-containing protein n=1 Tax=Lichenibacterium dinghuense TaxID=2895977 RepID=UPI001F186187|nr:PIN domain-containing protein [Lichenibacterium sp. 6Y81]